MQVGINKFQHHKPKQNINKQTNFSRRERIKWCNLPIHAPFRCRCTNDANRGWLSRSAASQYGAARLMRESRAGGIRASGVANEERQDFRSRVAKFAQSRAWIWAPGTEIKRNSSIRNSNQGLLVATTISGQLEQSKRLSISVIASNFARTK